VSSVSTSIKQLIGYLTKSNCILSNVYKPGMFNLLIMDVVLGPSEDLNVSFSCS
jgi:hypothetical protein